MSKRRFVTFVLLIEFIICLMVPFGVNAQVSDSISANTISYNSVSLNSVSINSVSANSLLSIDYDNNEISVNGVTKDIADICCPNSNPYVNLQIFDYTVSLNGTFDNFYYYHETGDYKCMQCMALANHIAYHVFGEDSFDCDVKAASEDGQTMYDFLKDNNASSGDILKLNYYSSGKVRPHYIVINGYDDRGIWFTDGYALKGGCESDSETIIDSVCEYKEYDYEYFEGVSGEVFNKTDKTRQWKLFKFS